MPHCCSCTTPQDGFRCDASCLRLVHSGRHSAVKGLKALRDTTWIWRCLHSKVSQNEINARTVACVGNSICRISRAFSDKSWRNDIISRNSEDLVVCRHRSNEAEPTAMSAYHAVFRAAESCFLFHDAHWLQHQSRVIRDSQVLQPPHHLCHQRSSLSTSGDR